MTQPWLEPAYTDAHSNLAHAMFKVESFELACEHYEIALSLSPGDDDMHYQLGRAKRSLEHREDALKQWQCALNIDPNHSKSMVELGYLFAGTRQFEKAEERFVKAIEIDPNSAGALRGCGTGLCGVAFRDSVGSIDGADISKKMVGKARTKRVYRNLWSGDLLDVLTSTEEKYQLVIAADVFIYVGNLETVFNTFVQRMTTDSFFIFSTGHSTDGDFSLEKSLRYTHSRAYIERIARNAKTG